MIRSHQRATLASAAASRISRAHSLVYLRSARAARSSLARNVLVRRNVKCVTFAGRGRRGSRECGRDPRGRQISIAFTGVSIEGQDEVRAGDDAAKAQWFDIEELPLDLAFDHDEMIKCGIEKLEQRWGEPHPTEP